MSFVDQKHIGVGAAVIVLKNHQVLLGQRQSGEAEGTWTLPGGKVELGERLVDAAMRETLEETGLVLKERDHTLVNIDDRPAYDCHFITACFKTETSAGEPTTKEPHKIDHWQWFDLDRLPDPLYELTKRGLQNLQQAVMYDWINKPSNES